MAELATARVNEFKIILLLILRNYLNWSEQGFLLRRGSGRIPSMSIHKFDHMKNSILNKLLMHEISYL